MTPSPSSPASPSGRTVDSSSIRLLVAVGASLALFFGAAGARADNTPPAFTDPAFDDSGWQTTILPPDSESPPPWPEHFDGTIHYRLVFPVDEPVSLYPWTGTLHLRGLEESTELWLNDRPARCMVTSEGKAIQLFRCPRFHRDANTLAISVRIRDGQGGIPPQPADALNLWLCTVMHVTGEVCQAYVEDEWTLPLAGQCKYLLLPDIPSSDSDSPAPSHTPFDKGTPPEGGAE